MTDKLSLDNTDRIIELHTKIIDSMCPDLNYSQEQIMDERKAADFVEAWRNGPYSVKSLQLFVSARCSYLYSQSELGRNEMHDRRRLLDYLFHRDDFIDALYATRESLGLSNFAESIEFESYGEAIDYMSQQLKDVGMHKPDDKYWRKVAVEIMHLRQKYRLAIEWDDILLCQVASPKARQLNMVKNMKLSQKFIITEAYGGAITVKFLPGISRTEIDMLRKILKPLTGKPTQDGCLNIWDMIKADRKSGMSWNKMSKEYGIDKDTIRKKLDYDNKHR